MSNKISSQQLAKCAKLARIFINPQEEERILTSVNGILNFVEKLQCVDISNHTPEVEEPMRLREDEVTNWESSNFIKENAPKSVVNMFAVPKGAAGGNTL